jgi:hypothetical protein
MALNDDIPKLMCDVIEAACNLVDESAHHGIHSDAMMDLHMAVEEFRSHPQFAEWQRASERERAQ